MKEILEFIFQDFWHYIGFAVLIMIIGSCIPTFSWTRNTKVVKEDK